jgi:hypothetical protein
MGRYRLKSRVAVHKGRRSARDIGANATFDAELPRMA